MIQIISYSLFFLTVAGAAVTPVLWGMNIIENISLWYFFFPILTFLSAHGYWLRWVERDTSKRYAMIHASAAKAGLIAWMLGIIIIVGLHDKIFHYGGAGEGGIDIILFTFSAFLGGFVAFCLSMFED